MWGPLSSMAMSDLFEAAWTMPDVCQSESFTKYAFSKHITRGPAAEARVTGHWELDSI